MSLQDTEGLSVAKFLQDSAMFELHASERLRLLAVELEHLALAESTRRGWAALERIYAEAERLAPDDPWVHASRGISATELASIAEPADAKRLLSTARASLLTAQHLDEADPDIAFALGYSMYFESPSPTEEALSQFERTISIKSDHAWALLYRAHCLQDLRRWREAAEAYTAVPKQAFAGPACWRMDLLLEQRGWCRLKAGDRVGAREDFESILARYEKLPAPTAWMSSAHLEDAVRECFPELTERFEALKARLR